MSRKVASTEFGKSPKSNHPNSLRRQNCPLRTVSGLMTRHGAIETLRQVCRRVVRETPKSRNRGVRRDSHPILKVAGRLNQVTGIGHADQTHLEGMIRAVKGE